MVAIFQVPANGQIGIPEEGFTFKHPEGYISNFTATFDHPQCGIRIVHGKGYDSKLSFTVQNILLGTTPGGNESLYAKAPPDMFAGLYLVRRNTNDYFTDTCNLFVINTDSELHYCLGFGYQILGLLESRAGKSHPVTLEEGAIPIEDSPPEKTIRERISQIVPPRLRNTERDERERLRR